MGNKNYYFVFLLFGFNCLFSLKSHGQLKVDAGNDVVLCFSDSSSSTVQLGGFPVASGGVEPYTYTWSGKILQFFGPKDSTWVYASYFLDDTTKCHPTFKMGKIPFDWPDFNLKVVDAAGNIKNDSVKIIDGTIFSMDSYMPPVTIKRGDSIQFYGDIYFYYNNFLPFKFTLSPNYGITDPTDLRGWAKPDTSTTYYLQVENTVGCVYKMSYWRINVDTTTVANKEVINPSTQCYLAHGVLVVNMPENNNSSYQLNVSTANGVIIHSGIYRNRNLRLSNLNFKKNQVFIVSIIDGKEKSTFKLISN